MAILGCSAEPVPTTAAPAPASPTTVPSATTTAAAAQGAPAGAIAVNASMNVAQVVTNAPAGATFYFTAGTYRRASITPRDNQVFIAQAGTVFDGENAVEYAFVGPANWVTIRGFEIKNYAPTETYGWNLGAITSKWFDGQRGGEGWLVEGVNVHHNRGAGVMLTNKGTIRGSYIHHNYAIGAKLYWAPNGGLIDGNEIAYNNFDSPPDYNETGGTKFAWTTGIIVRNNYVHHNNGPGLWTDIDNRNTLYENNRADDNAAAGIMHEISYAATIRSNSASRNGYGSQGWMFGAGILLANSSDTTVEGNTLAGNQSGVGIIHQNRGSYQARNITVRNNQITGPGWSGADQDIGQTGLFAGSVHFTGNQYADGQRWIFGDRVLNWNDWQAAGHDLSGTTD